MFKYGKKRPQGATRNAPQGTASAGIQPRFKSFLPSWLLVGFGIAVGMFFAFVLYLWKPWQPVKKVAAPVVAETPDTPAKESGEPRFDFYTLLPSQKVTTPESAASTNTARPTVANPQQPEHSKPSEATHPPVTSASPETKPDKPLTKNDAKTPKDTADENRKAKEQIAKDKQEKAPDKTTTEKNAKKEKEKQLAEDKAKEAAKLAAAQKAKETAKETVRYTLQAGSFKSNAEADRRRAAIMMSGLPVRVQKVTVKPGQDWYRVVVGPFANKDKASDARQNLQADGVDSLMVKMDKK